MIVASLPQQSCQHRLLLLFLSRRGSSVVEVDVHAIVHHEAACAVPHHRPAAVVIGSGHDKLPPHDWQLLILLYSVFRCSMSCWRVPIV